MYSVCSMYTDTIVQYKVLLNIAFVINLLKITQYTAKQNMSKLNL